MSGMSGMSEVMSLETNQAETTATRVIPIVTPPPTRRAVERYVNPYLRRAARRQYHRERDTLVRRYAWAIPNARALRVIARYAAPAGLVEVGAGTGYWASELERLGVDVLAYDMRPPQQRNHSNGYFRRDTDARTGYPLADGRRVIGTTFTTVLRGGTPQAGKHADRALLLCWPPYRTKMAATALKHYLKAGGQTVIYVGEGNGGCTGDDRFHDLLAQQFEEVETISIPRWNGMFDELFIYRRKPAQATGQAAKQTPEVAA